MKADTVKGGTAKASVGKSGAGAKNFSAGKAGAVVKNVGAGKTGAVYSTARVKAMLTLPLVLLLLLSTTLAGYKYLNLTPQFNPQLEDQSVPQPDRLGPWSNINQEMKRNDNWQQIVANSPFQLGEKKLNRTVVYYNGTRNFYDITYGSYPSIDGSTVAIPLALEFARQHLGFTDEEANGFVGFSTTHDAYVNLIAKGRNYSGGWISKGGPYDDIIYLDDDTHPVDIIIATGPSAEELEMAAQYRVSLIQEPICYDAFVFITHKNNPVNSLTLEQVRGIYSGAITNWKEVGGNDALIVPYQREANSGSQTGMIDLVMKDTPMLPPETVKVVAGMFELVDAVAEYQNNSVSIGYTYKYYIDNLYKNENIKILRIDGIPANETTIRSGAYPLSVCYYGVIRAEDQNAVGGKFLDWMLSKEGQLCVKQAGYIPYKEQ